MFIIIFSAAVIVDSSVSTIVINIHIFTKYEENEELMFSGANET